MLFCAASECAKAMCNHRAPAGDGWGTSRQSAAGGTTNTACPDTNTTASTD